MIHLHKELKSLYFGFGDHLNKIKRVVWKFNYKKKIENTRIAMCLGGKRQNKIYLKTECL